MYIYIHILKNGFYLVKKHKWNLFRDYWGYCRPWLFKIQLQGNYKNWWWPWLFSLQRCEDPWRKSPFSVLMGNAANIEVKVAQVILWLYSHSYVEDSDGAQWSQFPSIWHAFSPYLDNLFSTVWTILEVPGALMLTKYQLLRWLSRLHVSWLCFILQLHFLPLLLAAVPPCAPACITPSCLCLCFPSA